MYNEFETRREWGLIKDSVRWWVDRLCVPQIDIRKRETSKSSSIKADKHSDGLKSQKLEDDVQECYKLTPFSFFYLLVMWSSCDHFVTYCSCDIYCSVMSIVLWPIVQADSIVPVMPIILVILLFSFTISTSSIWPYTLRLDFLYLTVQQCNQRSFPTLILCPSLSKYLL